jgi:hypothetical protein
MTVLAKERCHAFENWGKALFLVCLANQHTVTGQVIGNRLVSAPAGEECGRYERHMPVCPFPKETAPFTPPQCSAMAGRAQRLPRRFRRTNAAQVSQRARDEESFFGAQTMGIRRGYPLSSAPPQGFGLCLKRNKR